MDLRLELSRNVIAVDGVSCTGHHRWEAALLHLLVTSAAQAPQQLTAHALNAALHQAAGQTPLTRKQVSRLFDSLEALFQQAGQAPELARRLHVGQRQRTVGPWRWRPQPGDRCTSDPPHWPAASAAAAALRAPAFHALPLPSAQATLCRRVLVVQGLMHDGSLAPAAEELGNDSAWTGETTELTTWRMARMAEVCWKLRQQAHAEAAVARAEALVAQDRLCMVLFGDSVRLLRPRMVYALDPVHGTEQAWAALQPLLQAPQQQDRLATGLAHNQAALCLRRRGERALHEGASGAGRAALTAALRAQTAALFCFATGEQPGYAQSAAANLAHLLAVGFVQAALPTTATATAAVDSMADVLAWHALSQAWHNRFELPQGSVWESIFLGDLWLYDPRARAAIQTLGKPATWEGKMPDTLDFYTDAVARAQTIGDPRQTAHVLLNAWHFTRQTGQPAAGVQHAAALWALLDHHPELTALLRAEGYRLPGRRHSSAFAAVGRVA